MYQHIFIDLDDTLWDQTANALDAFQETYARHHYERYFDSFEHFYQIYQPHNLHLWEQYALNQITKEELNRIRFLHPLIQVGIQDPLLAIQFAADFFALIPQKTKLKPNAIELLEHLVPNYNLYILSNGFSELQHAKLLNAKLAIYFKQVILSDQIQKHKPDAALFQYALDVTGSKNSNSLMIGDSFEADVVGAKGVGMDQLYYNFKQNKQIDFEPTYSVVDLLEINALL